MFLWQGWGEFVDLGHDLGGRRVSEKTTDVFLTVFVPPFGVC